MGVNFNFLCPLTLAWSPPHTHMHTHTQLQTNLQTHTHTHAHAHAHSHSHSHTHPSYLLCIASYTHWFWCVCDEVKWKLWAFYFLPSITLSYPLSHSLTQLCTHTHTPMHTLTLGFHGGQKVSFVLYSWSFSRWRKKKVDLILFTLNCKKTQVGKFGANEWKTDFQFGEEKLSEKNLLCQIFWIFAIVNLELDSQLLKLQQKGSNKN